ncbi:MAG: FAD-dependent oxidoreductase [Methylosarcina sp.]
MRIVIIGGVAAGTKAAAKARRVNPGAEIVLYQDEAHISYSACGMPYVISGVISNPDQIVIRKPQDFIKDNIHVFVRHRVTGIDARQKCVTVKNLETGDIESVDYDSLILATGARPIVPLIPGIELKGVHTLRSSVDLELLTAELESQQPKRAVIIGAGYIGLELAESLKARSIQTTIVEKAERILPQFDADMAQLLQDHLLEHGVTVVLNDGLAGIQGEKGHVSSVTTESGLSMATDLVIIAIGIRPNVQLTEGTGIELGQSGAIAVNARMETTVPSVFAAGDCCESFSRITGKPFWLPLGDIANLQGRVAGENAAGGNASFTGMLGTAIFKTFEMNVAMTGLSEKNALDAGHDPVSLIVTQLDRARYFPGGKIIHLKLIADRKDGKILGGQAIGAGAVDKVIDIVATALLGHLTCGDLENADFAYSPPFSAVLSPVIVVAGALNTKLGN